MPREPDPIGSGVTGDERDPERSAIDAAFQGMAADAAYQEEALQIAEEFATSDAGALEICERDMLGRSRAL